MHKYNFCTSRPIRPVYRGILTKHQWTWNNIYMHTLVLDFNMLHYIELLIRNLSRNILHNCLTGWKQGMKDLPAQRNSQMLIVTTESTSESCLAKRKLLISFYHWCPRITNSRNVYTLIPSLVCEAQHVTEKIT